MNRGIAGLDRRLATGVIAIVAVGAAALGYTSVRPLPVTVATVERDIPIEVYGLGTVEARVLSQIGFDVSGTLVAVHADHGDRVAKGTVLAALDRREQDARVAQAEASVAQAAAAIDEARANASRAAAVLKQSQRTNERKQTLVRRGAVSAQAAEDAQLAVDTAAAESKQTAARLAVAEANLKQAEATLLRERTTLAQHALEAAFDAVVVARHRELGAAVRAGEAVFTLVDPESVWLLVHVDEARAGGLRIGQPAQIRLRSLPGRIFHGHVARVEIESDRIGEERRVAIACNECPPEFHLGEQAEAVITKERLDEGLLVPRTAISDFDGTSGRVWIVADGRLVQRVVTFGERTIDGRLVVRNGVPEGAEIVAEPHDGLRLGRRARPEEKERVS
jgi:HlyD family secretion protein